MGSYKTLNIVRGAGLGKIYCNRKRKQKNRNKTIFYKPYIEQSNDQIPKMCKIKFRNSFISVFRFNY